MNPGYGLRWLCIKSARQKCINLAVERSVWSSKLFRGQSLRL